MKPRIFISSTFYDLKYIREDLANFVRSYGYEPVLFEDGDIGYTPGKNLDTSCYDSMRNSDMVILIIGGEYGSAASGEKKDEFKEYMSVTRNEFRTAVEFGIPIFVMIDKKVMAEYGVYEANYDDIEKENRIMVFPTTKSINVFRFIKEIKGIVTLPIQEFEKSSDIKSFVNKQWADMFKNYLSSLRNEKENRKIENSVNEMKTLIQKMNIMLDSVGKNVLSKENPEEYKNVINHQENYMFCDAFVEAFNFREKEIKNLYDDREDLIVNLLNCIKEIKRKEIYEDRDFWDGGFWDIEKRKKLLIILSNYNIPPVAIKVEEFSKVYMYSNLICDDKNREKILEILLNNYYFLRLLSCNEYGSFMATY